MKYPTTFGKYLLLERINVGGMAEVYKAKTFGVEGFEKILAIKRILPNMADDDEFINMFVDEARISVQLSQPNVVQIYELGKFENQYYIAMEYVPGKDLRQTLDRMRKKKLLLPVPASAFIISKICDGLDYAHRKTDPAGRPLNVIHRDVSPQNILCSYEGAIKVTDFGIAKAEDRASKTQAGVLKGKFGYMSPEQVRGMEIDRRSDVFAVGILLYEMVTGKRLFIGESDFSTLEKVRNAEVPSPREINPDISEELERVMLKALARERDERYQWASDLHDDLQQFLIEGTTIYNAKKLAVFMREEFGEEMAGEQRKMEEFMKVQAPNDMVDAAVSHQKAGPAGDDAWDSPKVDKKGERTMIFEATGFSDAPTQIADAAIESSVTGANRPRTRTQSQPGRPRTKVSVVSSRPKTRRHTRAGGSLPKSVAAIGAAAAAFVVLLVVLLILIVGGEETGSIVVTAQPTDSVDIYLDGTLVGTKTPLTLTDVGVGSHTLKATAAGFKEKAYRFDLVPGAPALIEIKLDAAPTGTGGGMARAPPTAAAPGATATLRIETTPPGASVRIANLPQGTTPVDVSVDPNKPNIIELSMAGYKTETLPVSFAPAETQAGRKVFLYKLTPGGTAASPPVASAGPNITVDSQPTGAMLSIDGRKVGITPQRVRNLELGRSYNLTVSKNGYDTWKETITFNGDQAVTAELSRASGGTGRNPRKPKPPKKPQKNKPRKEKPSNTTSSSPPAGGGKCSGSGARLSVMAIGAKNCTVTVGKKSLGIAPFFKKASPTGSCTVKLTCDEGKKYSTSMKLKNGGSEKVIVKDGMWK